MDILYKKSKKPIRIFLKIFYFAFFLKVIILNFSYKIMDKIIEIRNLKKSYSNGTVALSGINLSIAR